MTSEIESYLRELQAALGAADPALVQDALFDAEEHLQAEVAAGQSFSAVVEAYGTPQEVAAAYVGAAEQPTPAALAAVTSAPAPVTDNSIAAAVTASAAGTEPQPVQPPSAPGPYGPPPAQGPMAAATAPVPAAYPNAWRQIFGVFIDGSVYKSLLYMLIALATGTFYFTVVVTMLSTSLGTSVLIIGLPLLLLTLGFVRGMALFEGRVVELLLGTRMPRRPRAEFPGSFFQRLWFWLTDGRTWASLVYLVLMLPAGILYFSFAVTGLAVGLGLIALPFVQLAAGRTWIEYGTRGASEWLIPGWALVFFVIAGFLVLLGMFHAIKWIGRGHAAYAKTMLVRLAK